MTQNSKIFLDSCDSNQTILAIQSLSESSRILSGQTTNPTLLVKNPKVADSIISGKIELSRLMELYKESVAQISNLIPKGSVSIEVYAKQDSTVEDLIKQAEEFYTWIPNAHIKFPTTKNGLSAAEDFVNNGGRVNMTLVFTQEQAYSIHLATKNMKKKGDVFVSPFVGRLDDIGINGVDLIQNIVRMYNQIDSKVEVLAASLRTLDHVNSCIEYKSDILTCPIGLIQQLDSKTAPNPTKSNTNLLEIPYKNLTQTNWREVNINHSLTNLGLEKFVQDWTNILI